MFLVKFHVKFCQFGLKTNDYLSFLPKKTVIILNETMGLFTLSMHMAYIGAYI